MEAVAQQQMTGEQFVEVLKALFQITIMGGSFILGLEAVEFGAQLFDLPINVRKRKPGYHPANSPSNYRGN